MPSRTKQEDVKLIDPMTDDEESGFYLDEYELGKDHWAEEYATV